MPIITLTTDWNKSDYYIGAIKGALYSKSDSINVVDITHQIKPFNIFQTAFILKNCYQFYPVGTIHIIGVKTEAYKDQKYVLAECNNQYFIGVDNGLFSLMFKDSDPVKYFTLHSDIISSFPSLDIFTETAIKLANGEKPEIIGKETENIIRRVPLRATIEDNILTGSVVYIDSFQNAITNISKELFERVGNGKTFKIFVQSNHYVISRINNYYQETSVGEILAIFNSLGLLEIAINGGNAAELLHLDINSSIRIKFNK